MIFWILLVLLTKVTNVVPFHPEYAHAVKKHQAMCDELAKKPLFQPHMVVDIPWRIYYMWHYISDPATCVDFTFKHVTKWTVKRFREDMDKYLAEQPRWDTAMMFMKMSRHSNQLLMFANYPPGRITALANIRRDSNWARIHKKVSLLTYQLKLFRGGKYLVMMDCSTGIVTLSARADEPPFRAELAAVASGLRIGEGRVACLKEEELANQQE